MVMNHKKNWTVAEWEIKNRSWITEGINLYRRWERCQIENQLLRVWRWWERWRLKRNMLVLKEDVVLLSISNTEQHLCENSWPTKGIIKKNLLWRWDRANVLSLLPPALSVEQGWSWGMCFIAFSSNDIFAVTHNTFYKFICVTKTNTAAALVQKTFNNMDFDGNRYLSDSFTQKSRL